MAQKKSVNLLPEYFKTDKNSKFLSSALDPLIQTPDIERIDGYIGSKLVPNYNVEKDFYLNSDFYLRNNYSFEPALVIKDLNSEVNDVIALDDLINEIKVQGGKNNNLDRLFRSKSYSYDPPIDWDKLVNYSEYYWLPSGPEPIIFDNTTINIFVSLLGQQTYTFPFYIDPDTGENFKLSNGMKLVFTETVTNTNTTVFSNVEYIVEGVGSSIELVRFDLLKPNEDVLQVYNETFDSDTFDEFPFDGDSKLPIVPEYVTINKASKDLNPWTRYNRWFHKNIIEVTAKINNEIPTFPNNYKSKRPIIEFKPSLQLFNFGKTGIKNVDLIETSSPTAYNDINGSFGYYIDEVLLEEGHRIIFNNERNLNRLGKIYTVTFDYSGSSPIINLIEDYIPNELDSISINLGKNNTGKNYYYNSETQKWILSQEKTKFNQAPLFDLFNKEKISYTKLADKNNFVGNKIFGYDEGSGIIDSVLGFHVNKVNGSGIGSYKFKNYFMSDVITITSGGVSKNIPTGVTYIKDNTNDLDTLLNVWNNNFQNLKLPIIEIQTLTENTNTLYVNSINNVGTSTLQTTVYKKNTKIGNFTLTATNVINLPTTLNVNDVVQLKIVTDKTPNSLGYYETPISLSNNPLNGPISEITFTELSDHLHSIVNNLSTFEGVFPGESNLRDLKNYAEYGTRLVINSNPISFAQFFIGKKEHNLIDAVRTAANHYNQFKMGLLNLLSTVNVDDLPKNSLDEILIQINKNKNINSAYYNSDMLGYGPNKLIASYSVIDNNVTEYALSNTFDNTQLNYNSVLIYLNNDQLVHGKDYTFSELGDYITVTCNLNIDDVIDIVYYPNTLSCYVPLTPSKLGLYPKFVPQIIEDTSYAGSSVWMIQGHDGSLIKAYGTYDPSNEVVDYRDSIILEFEKRVYNNIKVTYNKNIFDVFSVVSGKYRNTNYLINEVNDVLQKDFISWAGTYNVDTITNSTFDESNYKTWNYKNSVTVDGNIISGTWRSIYNYYYDTDRPHTHPWEMLGHAEKPLWWDDYYSWVPGSKRTALINAIATGLVEEPPSTVVDVNYARPDFSSIVPVDNSGNLKEPHTFLVTDNGYLDKQEKWNFGDFSPAEVAWRRSSYYPFALNCLAAILYPCDYASTMFDLSRTEFNKINQLTYLEDDLYLDPRKLILNDGDSLTAGYGNYVVERGKQRYKDYISKLSNDLSYIDYNLFYKFGGFTSKEKLQITIDSIDPVSRNSGSILPYEDYKLHFNVSNPIDSVSISGIIIQKINGKFSVKGYDSINPYFTIFKPLKNLASSTITVGGKSESFVEYNSSTYDTNKKLNAQDLTTANSVNSKYYKQGQIVRYNNQYYRVKINHTPGSTFESTLYQQLPSLPIKGGVTVQLSSRFQSDETLITYGTEFNSIQDVYDFIIGYGEWLKSKGFVFDTFNTNFNKIIDWSFSAQEFLFWTTQNWADGNVITLSPFANYLSFTSVDSVVDNIFNSDYDFTILNADGNVYDKNNLTFERDGNSCVIKTTNELDGLFFANIRTIQKEHSLIFNNKTIFNDTIYAIETGYRQLRVKLSGFRTKDWNGDYFSPGFVYDAVSISDWEQFKSYLPNSVIRYNSNYYQAIGKINGAATFDFSQWVKLNEKPSAKLIPNFDYKINQFEDFYSLDIDNFDYNQQQMAQHLVGYTPRKYLNNIFTNAISQYKFYQGFIKEKGTRNSINRLDKAVIFDKQSTIQLNEEWAFRVGSYGSYSTFNEIEFNLEEGSYLENPYIIKLVDTLPTNENPLINYVKTDELLITPDNYITTSTFNVYESTFDDNNLVLLNAGYVRLDDVTATAYNKNSILDIANIDSIAEGSVIWTGFLENGDWDVFRYAKQDAKIVGVYVSAPAIDITFVTDIYHGLSKGDLISVKGFNEQVNGIYKVKNVTKINQFTVESSLTTIVDEDLLSPGVLFKFESCRYANIDLLKDDNRILKLKNQDKIWVDRNLDGKWNVIQKLDNFNYRTYESINTYGGQQLGTDIFYDENTNIVLFSSPGKWSDESFSYGSVSVYEKTATSLEKKYEYVLNESTLTYCNSLLPSEFGYSLAYDISKKYFFAGAPSASNVRAGSATGVVLSTGTGTIKSFENEGIVKISIRKPNGNQDITKAVLVHPNALTTSSASHARFGHSLYITQVPNTTATTLLVSAPGDNFYAGAGSVFAYSITTASEITISAHPTGINVVSTTTISLTTGSQWGHSIAGDKLGNQIAISAPNYYSTITDQYGVVQIFNKNLTWKQTLLPEEKLEGNFGSAIEVSKSGTYLLVSAPNSRPSNNSFGTVFVYKLNSSNSYDLFQTINNPVSNTDLKFGYKVSINENEDSLVISSVGTNISKFKNFDTNLENSTTFDSNTTKFYDKIPDSGTVHVYSKLGNYFINSAELYDAEILEGSKYGAQIVSNNNSILIGAPSYKGVGINSVNILSTITVSVSTTLYVEFTPPTNVNGSVPTAIITYKNNNGVNKTVDQILITNPGSGYLYPPSLVLKDQLGSVVSTNSIVYLEEDNSKVYQFNKIDSSINGFKILREQDNTVDIDTIKRITLINNFKEEIIDYLDVIDPVKGKIAGVAEQELKYKLAADPAVYSIGIAGTINDSQSSWIDDHVGELWWDLSTAKFLWYEQGDEIFRKNNWGKLFPGATIDVYEWVKSSLLPTEWAAQADTNEGLTQGVSGQPKYPDNSVISVKQMYNNVTGSFENVYYYWVKNKVLIPDVPNRRLSSLQVASYIADPVANGLKFASILSAESVAFSNIQQTLIGNRINANIVIDKINNVIPKHTEWVLMEEGNKKDVPTTLLEKKLIDSLLGHDFLGNSVPDPTLSYRNRYGLSIRPQQTLFKDRNEALRNVIEFANSVLIKNRITGLYNFDTLLKEEPIPAENSGEYDEILNDNSELELYETDQLVRAEVECFVSNGKIRNVIINNPGYGYTLPPEIKVLSDNQSAKFLTVIDNEGRLIDVIVDNPGLNFAEAPDIQVRSHTVIIANDSTAGNKWSKNVFDYTSKVWLKQKTQAYNTPLYWEYVDWKDNSFIQFKTLSYVVSSLYELSTLEDNVKNGNYIKVKNGGNGYYIILERIASDAPSNFIKNYNLVYSENGTIQIKDTVWNFNLSNYAYDKLTLDETLYDQIPDLEIQYILEALKNDIFIKELKVNWNLLFFTAVKYALTEQKLLDWAFKTSFVSLKNTLGDLTQKPIYKLDNDEYFEEYIKEVKPYRTKIRTSTGAYSSLEDSRVNVTDFDLPFYFNESTNKFEPVTIGNSLMNEYPWKSWYDNYTYEIEEIIVAEQGSGYTQRPTVIIVSQPGDTGVGATAEAYLRSGKIYRIVLTNPGSGYTKNPYVVISGGGPNVTKNATASAALKSNVIRKNVIGIKFDRYSVAPEINFDSVFDTFICDGVSEEYELTWYANPYKETIVPKLDGKLIYSADYTIIFDRANKISKFKFLNFVPNNGQLFEITYEKNINLYNAIDRIENYYNPDDNMAGKDYAILMSGYDYPNTVIQGLPFKYATPWNPTYNPYENFVWDDLIENYTSAKLISDASVGTSTLFLNSVDNIVPGQVVNVISTSTKKIRKTTVVESVSTTNNSIVISTPIYNLKLVKSLGTSIGSTIVVQTKNNFYGAIEKGDIAFVSNITSSGYNGQYVVSKIENNNTLFLTATSVLSSTTAILTTSSQIKISSILENIDSDNVLFNKFVNTVTNVSSTSSIIYYKLTDIVTSTVFVNGVQIGMISTPSTEYYELFSGPNNNTNINVYNLTASTSTIVASFYTNPTVEFWNINTLYSQVDTGLEGGSWAGSNFLGAEGIDPEEFIVDGEKLLSQNVGYGPEELVNGHVLDSLGINVYTRSDDTSALVITGAYPALPGSITSFTLGYMPIAWAGIMVYSEGQIFERINDLSFTKNNQYYVEGNTIYTAPQPSNGRIGYTIITSGGENVLDSNIVVSNTSTALVESLASIDDVKHAYVLVNGEEISEINTTTSYGFMLTATNEMNNRACVKVYNLPSGTNTIEAWFFSSPYDKFNRVNEEYFTITSPQSTFILSKPPATLEPASPQAIVELGSNTSNTRRRLLPPWVSYYEIEDNNQIFDIDNKNVRPSGYYTADQVKVYANGVELISGFDYTVNLVNNTITLTENLLQNGDAIAIMTTKDYEYIISGNILQLATPASSATLKVMSFTNHDNLLMKTEKFNQNGINRYVLDRPVLNDNYVWVFVNGIPLVHRYDFEVLDDLHTIQFSEWVITNSGDSIMITTVNIPSNNNIVLGFRIFKDMFDKLTYRRITEYHSTMLTKDLYVFDTEIQVENDDKLITPDPIRNKPGVIIVDGERIEFFEKAGNVLKQLRRSTLGTGPATVSQAGTTVIDQSIQQKVPYNEQTYVQTIKTTNNSIYPISTVTTTATGQGIVLTPNIDAVNQIVVYYGGRQLRKSPLVVHDIDISYNPTDESLTTYPPEFTVNTLTQELVLNLNETITTGTLITVIQKKGYIWTGTESLLTSEVKQAEFLRKKTAVLPDVYYYGGPKELLDSSYFALTDENDNPLEE
jgi:hypothetical protein